MAKKSMRGTDYSDFEKSCGYGSVTGILGANCRHHYYPYIDGVHERTYTDRDLEEMKGENNQFIYEGRQYDGYSASQKQRQIEREVRKQKRRLAAYEALDTPEAKRNATDTRARIRALNKKYKEFSEAAGLQMQRERMKVVD